MSVSRNSHTDNKKAQSPNTYGATCGFGGECASRVLDVIRKSRFYTPETKETGAYIENLTCPECGTVGRAFIGKDKPWCIKCNRENTCGAVVPVHKVFPELRVNVERDAPPVPEEPHRPARHYLHHRGIWKALEGLAPGDDYRYLRNLGGTESGGIGFPLVNSDGETVWNSRFFCPPGRSKTHNEAGTSFKGAYWRHPALKYDPDRETFVAESIIDALSLIEMGQQAIAISSAVTTPEGMDLSDFPNLALAFDNDLAGWKAGAEKWRPIFPDAPIILPPAGMDWNDFLCRHNGADGDTANEFNRRRHGEFVRGTDPEAMAEKIRKGELWKKTERKLAALNREYAAILVGGKFRILREFVEPIFNRPSIELSSKDDFAAFHANRLIENPEKGGKGQNKEISTASLWMRWEKRRDYNGLVFNPPTAPGVSVEQPGYYNLWTGFGIEPKKGDWSLLREHIWTNIASENEEHFRWLLAWMARLVQSPGGDRPGTAVVLRGKRGTGKGTLVSQFQSIFGAHFLHLMNQTHLTGKFNGHLKNAVVVFCDEGFWAGDKTAEGVLKGMITEDTLPCEDKNEKMIQVKNRINLFIASNNDWVIPAGLEERRFFVLEVSDRHIQDKPYFRAIKEQMNNGGREAFLYDLLDMDISEIDLRTAPKTKALMEQIEASMGPVEKWWYQHLRDGVNRPGAEDWDNFVETQTLYDDFKEYTRSVRPNAFIMDQSPFARRLRDLTPGMEPYRPRGDGRQRGYNFPPLEDCRKAFERAVGMDVDWEEI